MGEVKRYTTAEIAGFSAHEQYRGAAYVADHDYRQLESALAAARENNEWVTRWGEAEEYQKECLVRVGREKQLKLDEAREADMDSQRELADARRDLEEARLERSVEAQRAKSLRKELDAAREERDAAQGDMVKAQLLEAVALAKLKQAEQERDALTEDWGKELDRANNAVHERDEAYGAMDEYCQEFCPARKEYCPLTTKCPIKEHERVTPKGGKGGSGG